MIDVWVFTFVVQCEKKQEPSVTCGEHNLQLRKRKTGISEGAVFREFYSAHRFPLSALLGCLQLLFIDRQVSFWACGSLVSQTLMNPFPTCLKVFLHSSLDLVACFCATCLSQYEQRSQFHGQIPWWLVFGFEKQDSNIQCVIMFS